ncbi:hypothetical protein GB937_009316 [Aspergillus fischeri]|nr:hypothetical protein GB937_009316 [Aspergillus fischeri]
MTLAAAMDISNGKQADSIELSDVTIGRPILLETSSVEIETSIAIESGNDGANSIQAEFSLNKGAAHDERRATVAKGRLRMTFADHELELLSSRQPKPCGVRPVNINQFYDSLSEVGLRYRGPFRALTSAERRMDYACGVIAPTTDEAPSTSGLLHPAMLEACFQALLLAFAAPRDGSLWTIFVPTQVGRLTVFPNSSVGINTPVSVTIDTHLHEYTAGYKADLPTENLDVRPGRPEMKKDTIMVVSAVTPVCFLILLDTAVIVNGQGLDYKRYGFPSLRTQTNILNPPLIAVQNTLPQAQVSVAMSILMFP